MEKRTVSVIIPTYNRSYELKLTLDSLVKQKTEEAYLYQMEVIVVDDGSTDDTKALVYSYKNQLTIKYFFQEDKGFRVAAARNLGAIHANGDICIFIDSGILVDQTCVMQHLKCHDKMTQNAAVIGYIYGCDNQIKDESLIMMKDIIDTCTMDEALKLLDLHGMGDGRDYVYKLHGEDISSWPAPWLVFWSGNISIKREFFMSVGMFDESFTMWGGEDNELGIRLWLNDAIFILDKNIKSIHYPHDVEETEKDAGKFIDHVSMIQEYIYEKHPYKEVEVWKNNSFIDVNSILGLRSIKNIVD